MGTQYFHVSLRNYILSEYYLVLKTYKTRLYLDDKFQVSVITAPPHGQYLLLFKMRITPSSTLVYSYMFRSFPYLILNVIIVTKSDTKPVPI